MLIEDIRESWSKEKPSLENQITDLLLQMFSKEGGQYFDHRTFDPDLVKQFVTDKDVQFLAYTFTYGLQRQWKRKFPKEKKLEPRGFVDLKVTENKSNSMTNGLTSQKVNKVEQTISSSAAKSPIQSQVSETLGRASASHPNLQGATNSEPKVIPTSSILSSKAVGSEKKNENTEKTNLSEKQTFLHGVDPNVKLDSNLTNDPPKISAVVPAEKSPASGGSVIPTNSGNFALMPPQGTVAQTDVNKQSTPSPAGSTSASNAKGIANALKPGQIPAAHSKPAVMPEIKPTFYLPNCNVGSPFSAKIEGTHSSGRKILIENMRFPDGLGLSFSRETQVVNGTPLISGEFELGVQWKFADSAGNGVGICRLTSNPDPKSLWKVIEPPADLPYRKQHSDHRFLKAKDFCIAAASRRGRSHEHAGSFRDDDFFIHHDQVTGWSVLIVADGAGSAKNSREGSRIAVETSGKFLVDSLLSDVGLKISVQLAAWESGANSREFIGREFHYLFHKMASIAIQGIESEADDKKIPAKEYSTTLLAAAIKRDGANTFVASFWIGDGAIAAYGPKGTVKIMGVPDGGEFAGQTRFLDRNTLNDQGFGKRVRVGKFLDVSAVMLLTDGVSDPYFETDSGLLNPAYWDLFWDEIEPHLKDQRPEHQLVEWLHFFKQGHHDDRTIAVLW